MQHPVSLCNTIEPRGAYVLTREPSINHAPHTSIDAGAVVCVCPSYLLLLLSRTPGINHALPHIHVRLDQALGIVHAPHAIVAGAVIRVCPSTNTQARARIYRQSNTHAYLLTRARHRSRASRSIMDASAVTHIWLFTITQAPTHIYCHVSPASRICWTRV